MKIVDRIRSCLKSVDEQFEDLGFVKVSENTSFCAYRRRNKTWPYTHKLDIVRKKGRDPIIYSYDENDYSVYLREKEAWLTLRKLKEMRRKYKW